MSRPGASPAPTTSAHRVAPVAFVADVHPLLRPAAWPPRDPPRPQDRRQTDYADRFDFDTIWFDVVSRPGRFASPGWFGRRGRLVAVGPPLRGWTPMLHRATFHLDGTPLPEMRTRPRDRTQTTTFTVRGERGRPVSTLSATLAGDDAGQPLSVGVSPDQTAVFAGRRVLFTVSKDNDLRWIQDWARWHVRVHGTDAVIVYDNGSTAYTPEELLAALAAVDELAVVVVVPWRFPYGPGGNGEQDWDSDFAQIGAMEHARQRFLRRAAGVLNADVDELVHTTTGRSVYEYARRSPSGFVAFHGRWAHPAPTTEPGSPVRHAGSTWVADGDAPCPFKWCGVPARMPERAQWLVHGSWNLHVEHVRELWYSHHRAVSTHWKVDRTSAEHNAASYRHDPVLARELATHLGDAPAPVAGSPAPPAVSPDRPFGAVLSPRRWRRGIAAAVRRAYHAGVALRGR